MEHHLCLSLKNNPSPAMAQRLTTTWMGLSVCAALAATGCQPQLPQQSQQQTRLQSAAAPPCSSQDLSTEALFSQTKSGVAVVTTGTSSGSAFVIRHQDGNTLLVTNSHVVEGTNTVRLKWADGSQDQAAVISDAGGASPQTDLALLKLTGLRGKPLNLKATSPKVGADIVTIGAPKGLEFSLSRGVVSSLRDAGEILQIDAPINPGNSGGPVLDHSGCVVGVATFKLTDSEGLNFAVASSVIQVFLTDPTTRDATASESKPPIGLNPDNPNRQTADIASCWFELQTDADNLQGFECKVTSRTNADGHTVFDVEEPSGLKRTVLLWENQTAEVLLHGHRYEGQWNEDSDGDIHVHLDGGSFAFRPRS